jgi:hypothetical protein
MGEILACMEQMRNAYRILDRKPDSKDHLPELDIVEGYQKMYLREVLCESGD